MATKRGICPYCDINKIQNRIFMVNPEASVCYCPNCMKTMEPKEAIDNYNNLINTLVKKADNTLFVNCDPVLAYQQYADVLEIDNTITKAYLGRLLCLMYMSKVRKSFINEATILLKEESDEHFRKAKDVEEYIAVLRKMNRVADEYEFALHKKLTFRNYYFDVDCLTLYLTHLSEIISLKEAIYSEAKSISEKFKTTAPEVLINNLEHNIDEKKTLLKSENVLVNGDYYVLKKLKRTGEIEIEKIENKHIDTKLSRYRMATLNIEDKKRRYITDIIFKDYTRLIKANRSLKAFLVITSLITIGGIAVAGIFYKDMMIFAISAGVGGLFLVISLILLFLHLSWNKIIKKRKMEII